MIRLISVELDISDGDSRIYPMEVGYIRPDLAAKALEPDRKPDMSNASDMSALGQIYPTWNWCQGSGT
jgi:hypothetical protein